MGRGFCNFLQWFQCFSTPGSGELSLGRWSGVALRVRTCYGLDFFSSILGFEIRVLHLPPLEPHPWSFFALVTFYLYIYLFPLLFVCAYKAWVISPPFSYLLDSFSHSLPSLASDCNPPTSTFHVAGIADLAMAPGLFHLKCPPMLTYWRLGLQSIALLGGGGNFMKWVEWREVGSWGGTCALEGDIGGLAPLFTSWPLWGEQHCSVICSHHDVLCHHRPKGNRAGRPWLQLLQPEPK
jgi:hypothetical protein